MKTSRAVLEARQQVEAPNEARLASIEASGMLDRAGAELDAITDQVRELMGTEMAALTVVLGVELRMLSTSGFNPITIPRELSFCTHVVEHGRPIITTDATIDPFFIGHPLVATEGSVRSYCGVPITTADGHMAGALCAIGSSPRDFSPTQLLELSNLAQQARAILIPGVKVDEVLAVTQWFSEDDPLASWINDPIAFNDELKHPTVHRLLPRWLRRGNEE